MEDSINSRGQRYMTNAHKREVDAKLRREFKKADLDAIDKASEENDLDEDEEFDNKSNDDEFLDGLQKQHDQK